MKNWRTFQHYNDRRPPWIKVYIALLDDLDFCAMSEAAQLALIKLWLMAARFGHPLPHDPKLLEQRGGVRRKPLAELLAHGWVIAVESDTKAASAARPFASTSASKDASNPASTDASENASALASPRVRARAGDARSPELEREREREQHPSSAARTEPVVFADPDANLAAAAFRTHHPHPDAFDRALRKVAERLGGNGFGWEVVGRALVQMHTNGAVWHGGLFAGYCRRVAQGEPADTVPLPRAARGNARRSRNLEILASHAREVANG